MKISLSLTLIVLFIFTTAGAITSNALVIDTAYHPDTDLVNLGNADFESGNLDGWGYRIAKAEGVALTAEDYGRIDIMNEFISPTTGKEYDAQNGSYFAVIKTDVPGLWTIIENTFLMKPGSSLSGWAAFVSEDLVNKGAIMVRILDGDMVLDIPWQYNTPTAPSGHTNFYGQTDWGKWEWTNTGLEDKSITVQFLITNIGDSHNDSWALLDNIVDPPAGTEPSTLRLVLGGLAIFLGIKSFKINR